MNIYPKDYFATKPPVNTGTCFVIMPFASEYNGVFSVIKDAVESEEIQLECKRGDDFLKPHILDTILENIAKAEYIIADLTGENANVFYELGLAHCVKDMNNIILITQDMKFVPFDLRQYRCIVYGQSASGTGKLKHDLIKTLQQSIGRQYHFSINEEERFLIPERLSGDRYLYEVEIWAPYIGDDAAKTQVSFKKCKADGTKERMPIEQDLYIYKGNQERLDNVSWHIRLMNVANKKATFVLRKSGS